jgi:phosphoribosylanthranilate isomerase
MNRIYPVIKICGMRYSENILAVASLKPDILGFIFYGKSLRFAGQILSTDILSSLPSEIMKAGVFVDAGFDEISLTASKYSLDIIQLHGSEAPELCRRLKKSGKTVIKAFNVKDSSSFGQCIDFISCTDYFLFDTLTGLHGGSGNKFNWKILDLYDLGHPFFLSGGISGLDADLILQIKNPAFFGIDLNSRFEIEPGLKDVEKLKYFIHDILHKYNQL